MRLYTFVNLQRFCQVVFTIVGTCLVRYISGCVTTLQALIQITENNFFITFLDLNFIFKFKKTKADTRPSHNFINFCVDFPKNLQRIKNTK